MGAVVLGSLDPLAFDDQVIPTINSFADHLAIAVANHRLAQEKDRRLRELAFLNETGQAITSTLNLDRVLLDRGMTLTALSERVDVSLPNLSILKTNKARAVRFTTLAALCKALDCQPGDLLEFREEK